MKTNNIMKILSSLILATTLTISSITINAQYGSSLYYMHHLPQANIMNPAMQWTCNWYLYGLGLPVIGQVPPPLYLSAGGNAFSFKQLMPYDKTLDSIITPLHPNYDIDKFFKRLHKVNYLSLEMHIPLIAFGFRWDDYFISFDITEKLDFRFGFPKNLLIFLYEGNGSKTFLGKTADFKGFGFNVTHYREYAIAVSRKWKEKWYFGARGKMLFGKANAWMSKNELGLTTDANTFDLTAYSDIQMNMSLLPFIVEYNRDDTNGIQFNDNPDFTAINYIFNRKNIGFALDLGAVYSFSDKITFLASAIDLGFIGWKKNVYTFSDNGKFMYKGYDVIADLARDDDEKSEMDKLTDTLKTIFKPYGEAKPYSTWLAPKIFIGTSYKFNEKISFGGLIRNEIFFKHLHSSLTLSANTNFTKWFTATLSYTIINSNMTNIGLGYGLKLGPFQMYIISDNINAFLWPQAAKYVNLRMGMNLIFGCKKAFEQRTKVFF